MYGTVCIQDKIITSKIINSPRRAEVWNIYHNDP